MNVFFFPIASQTSNRSVAKHLGARQSLISSGKQTIEKLSPKFSAHGPESNVHRDISNALWALDTTMQRFCQELKRKGTRRLPSAASQRLNRQLDAKAIPAGEPLSWEDRVKTLIEDRSARLQTTLEKYKNHCRGIATVTRAVSSPVGIQLATPQQVAVMEEIASRLEDIQALYPQKCDKLLGGYAEVGENESQAIRAHLSVIEDNLKLL